MTNFRITFSYPWLLLLIIPAFALTFFLYFRISKRYRRTRNRIVSMVLHLVAFVLSVSVLAGIEFRYEIPNLETEVILLVDSSYSGEKTDEDKDHFIQSAIQNSRDVCQIGIVTFGYGEPVYAVPLTTDVDSVYSQYIDAEKPDCSATDIASALNYTKDLFKNKETAKIVVISDGLETDGKVATTIKAIAAEGIEVSTVYFEAKQPQSEVQLIGMTTPDYNVNVGDEFKVGVSVQSSFEGNVELELYDNGAPAASMLVDLKSGTQEFEVSHSFAVPGLHSLSFKVSGGADEYVENNVYQSYMYLESFTKVLLVERNVGESEALKELLEDENELLEITTLNILDEEKAPKDLNALRQFDQVVLVNIANADMPEGFDQLLYNYVNDIGGGVLTVGGNQVDENGNAVLDVHGEVVANAYNREDMYNTLYQEMLPVQAIDYTPPIGVMLIIDRSGSMDGAFSSSGQSKLDLAKEGAKACLNALSERDWCGVMTLEETYSEEIKMTPLTQRAKIEAAIDAVEIGGGTVFTGALERSGAALKALTSVQRRHVILVTDGIPADGYDEYVAPIRRYHDTSEITFSFVIIGEDISSSDKTNIKRAAEVDGGGRFYDVWDVSTLPRIMREELNMPEIKAVNHEPFVPTIANYTNVVTGIDEKNMPELDGFYGTKLKTNATATLMGEFVPIYAQWKYGEGMVGSFMCDLNEVWSAKFMESATGRRIISNIINGLFPTQNIRPQDMDIVLQEENYNTNMSIYTDMEQGEKIELEITSPTGKGSQTETRIITPSEEEGYSRISFSITQPGVHLLTVKKRDAKGVLVSQVQMYKTFSYSKEYDMFVDVTTGADLMESLAINGRGEEIVEAEEIYEEIERTLKRTYDPRVPFIIIALVLFLLDIAVRKFKFKWPHEIVRDYKAKKALQQKTN
ncbi:MAG: VWA domain-containing protein [Clostridiales bacterium]|nr:VWA domain-containing protein [Clostridiales bacterium]